GGEALRVVALRFDRQAALVPRHGLDPTGGPGRRPHARALPGDLRSLQPDPPRRPRAARPSVHLEGQRPLHEVGDREGCGGDAAGVGPNERAVAIVPALLINDIMFATCLVPAGYTMLQS